MAKVLYMWFTKLALVKFGLQFMLPQSLENRPQMIFMLMFSRTEHKYIIQVHKYKAINVLPCKGIVSMMPKNSQNSSLQLVLVVILV